MSTLNDLRANISIHIQTQMDPLRGKYGDDNHAMHCLGVIDGAASSLCLARGPEHTAMELYRIADGIVMQMPAKAFAVPRRRRWAILRDGDYRGLAFALALGACVAAGAIVARCLG